jgi:ElaB/YqjD/DUF883 family membrane-anchored ribosome-binding protein
MINVTNEPSDTHKNPQEIMEEITEKLMEKTLNIFNQKVQDALKKLLETKNKEHEKAQNQTNKFRKGFNKHQSETKDIIKTMN